MERFKIAVIAGDGIGPEVIAEGKKVLSGIAAMDGTFAVEFTDFPWGCEYYLQTGKMMDEDGLEKLKAFDAIYLGAVGYPGVPDNVSLGQLLLKIRRGFDQYVNLRPVKLLEGAPCPLAGVKREDIDMIVVRENSEGEYATSAHASIRVRRRSLPCRQAFSRARAASASCVMRMSWRAGNTRA